MMTTLKHELEEKLNKLKGVLLLGAGGNVYLLKDYELSEQWTDGGWFTSRKNYWNIKFSYHTVKDITNSQPWDRKQIIEFVNDRIEDRNRYLILQRSLKSIGCTIVTKKFNDK